MIEEDDAMICSIFEVYDKTKDKNEFIENIKILHSMKERRKLINRAAGLINAYDRVYNRTY